MICELKYSNTNTYLIRGKGGALLFDTGWAGTFPLLCRCLGEKRLRLQDIGHLMISHFHPDHMGIAQEIADQGVVIIAAEEQREFIHSSDHIFEKEKNSAFRPIDDSRVRYFRTEDSREMLKEMGISGEIIPTPGHSEDSISLWLDRERALFVGDLAPLYELEMHKGTETGVSWERLMALKPRHIYYGHAKAAHFGLFTRPEPRSQEERDVYALVRQIMKLIDKGCPTQQIVEKTGADRVFVEDVTRMYLTHQNVGVQGILDRIEIKGR